MNKQIKKSSCKQAKNNAISKNQRKPWTDSVVSKEWMLKLLTTNEHKMIKS